MNKIFLIGNLTRDPEVSTTPSGVTLCKFGIAVNRQFANANGEREVDFFNIVAWRGLAENCGRFLTKGKKVGICGRLEIRNYDDKDGNKRTTVDVSADDVEFLSPRGEGEGGGSFPQKEKSAELKPIDSDDLPF